MSHYPVRSLLFVVALGGVVAARGEEPLPPGAVARLGTVRFPLPKEDLSDGIVDLSFAPDGRTLYCGDGNRLLTWAGEKQIQEIHFDRDAERRAAVVRFAPGGRFLVTVSDAGDKAQVRELPSGRPLFAVPANKGEAAIAFSDDGRLLAVSAPSRRAGTESVTVYKLKNGNPLLQIQLEGHPVRTAFSPDGKSLLIAEGDAFNAELRLWDLTARGPERVLHTFRGEGVCSLRIAFSPDGRLLLCLGDHGGYILDVRTGEMLDSLYKRNAAAFSPDGRLLALADDEQITVMETLTRAKRIAFSGHRGPITSLAFSADGGVLASGGLDTTILLWDVYGKRTADPAAPPMTPRQLESLWADLDAGAEKAGAAMRRLSGSPEQAMTLLRERLRPAEGRALDAATVDRLIAELDSEEFAIRQRATQELERSGRVAIVPLRKVLAGEPSLELHRRAGDLLEKLDRSDIPPELFRPLRALEVLEHMDGPEARRLLRRLAEGNPNARLTEEAAAALRRLGEPARAGAP
jgi:hypothetical protein